MVSLSGLRIINTRPEQRATQLTQALEQQGATVFSLPLLEIIALELSAVGKDCLLNLDRYHSVFVVSPTAAELGLNALADYWPQWPVGIEWLAVGQSTAQVLRSYFIEPTIPEQETSEGLLQLPQLQQLTQGQRLLVLRGEGGRNLVRDSLQNRGVKVDYVDLYRRQLPQHSLQQWPQIQQQTIDVVIISSGETLTQWLQLAGQQAQNIPILVISPRLVELAQQQGFKTVLSSVSIHPKDICNTLSQWRKS